MCHVFVFRVLQLFLCLCVMFSVLFPCVVFVFAHRFSRHLLDFTRRTTTLTPAAYSTATTRASITRSFISPSRLTPTLTFLFRTPWAGVARYGADVSRETSLSPFDFVLKNIHQFDIIPALNFIMCLKEFI